MNFIQTSATNGMVESRLKKMEEKYRELVVHGAGQIAGNHWVAASALVYAQTLDYIFDKSNNKMTRDSGGAVAYALIEYFEQGKTGPVV